MCSIQNEANNMTSKDKDGNIFVNGESRRLYELEHQKCN